MIMALQSNNDWNLARMSDCERSSQIVGDFFLRISLSSFFLVLQDSKSTRQSSGKSGLRRTFPTSSYKLSLPFESILL